MLFLFLRSLVNLDPDSCFLVGLARAWGTAADLFSVYLLPNYREVTHLSRARVRTTLPGTTSIPGGDQPAPPSPNSLRILFPAASPCGIIPAHLFQLIPAVPRGRTT